MALDRALSSVSQRADVEFRSGHFEASLLAPSVDSAALTATLSLYRGDFLADFSLPDSETFDAWASAERERYRLIATRGLTDNPTTPTKGGGDGK